jgi:hypothetical protein
MKKRRDGIGAELVVFEKLGYILFFRWLSSEEAER